MHMRWYMEVSYDHHVIILSFVTLAWISSSITDILKFDNSYSWARSKEVFYTVKVSAPSVCREPHPPSLVQQQEPEKAGSPHPHWSTCHAPSSSEDEFFDCLQEAEVTTCTQETETILARVQDSPQLSSPNQARTTATHRLTLTGTSVSTPVWPLI